MSTDLKSRDKAMHLTRFWGGDRGQCVQVTMKSRQPGEMFDLIQVNREQALRLAHDLMDFAAGKEVEDWDA